MQIGQTIRLRAYGDEVLQRVVVSEVEDTVYVCMQQEFEAAKADNRAPKCVGFNRKFIIHAQM